MGVSTLARVSCASPRDCIALGGRGGAPVEHWDGTKWSIDHRPRALDGVSCVPGSGCVAVGGDARLAGGIRWSIPASIPGYRLSSLSCASPTFCTAIGRNTKLNPYGVMEHWDGQRWAIERPDMVGFDDGFAAVSCPSATACIALGAYNARYCPPPSGGTFPYCNPDPRMLTERWNGTQWSRERTSSRPPFWGLTDMSCATPSACVAIGAAVAPGTVLQAPRVELWNGKTWSIQPIPNAQFTNPLTAMTLAGVSCPSATACTVVGGYNGGTGGGPVAEHWDGKRWSVQSFPDLASPRGGMLNDVSCPTPTDCTAVGFGILPPAPASEASLDAARWTGRG
jgi:hypothetical protein